MKLRHILGEEGELLSIAYYESIEYRKKMKHQNNLDVRIYVSVAMAEDVHCGCYFGVLHNSHDMFSFISHSKIYSNIIYHRSNVNINQTKKTSKQ